MITRMLIAAAVLGVAACGRNSSTLPFYRSAQMTPEWLPERAAAATAMHHVARFSLVDQHGAQVTNAIFSGKVSVVHFFFTTCGDVCPTTTRHLASLLRAVPDGRLQVLSHSVTPAADSVSVLRRYAAAQGITDARWHLLTGAPHAIERLATASYFVRFGNDTTYGRSSIAHTESVLLVDGEGRLRGVYAGSLPLEMDRLRDDLETLLREEAPAK